MLRRRPMLPPDPAAVRARLAALLGVAAPDPPSLDPQPSPPDTPPADVAPADPDPVRRGVVGIALIAALAVVVTGVVVWRGRPRAVDVPPPAVAAAPSAAALLVIDVAGDVRHPGLVRLPAGSRVADALAAAGGVTPGATTGGLNLARKLVDGEQVVVGRAAAGPSGAPASGGLLDLNAATADQLDALPGIGPVLADRIVAWREAHGRFASVDQLREVSGIGARKYESIKSLLTV